MIDSTTGSRLLVTLGGAAANGSIRDMTVTPTLLAVIGADYSVSAYRIPRTWSEDDVATERLLHLPGASFEVGVPFKVEWKLSTGKGSPNLLAIAGKRGVVLVDPADVDQKLGRAAPKPKLLTAEGVSRPFSFTAC